MPAAPWRRSRGPSPRPDGRRAQLARRRAAAGRDARLVAGPPKKGKTWLGLGLALAIAAGRPLFGEYAVAEPRTCSTSRSKGRASACARASARSPAGSSSTPTAPTSTGCTCSTVRARSTSPSSGRRRGCRRGRGARRRARRRGRAPRRRALQGERRRGFALVRDGLEPLLAAGRTVALLHHFGKLSETQKERSPGERMAGTGAMYGALDVGLLITRSESGARRLRVDVEARDFAAPDALGVVIPAPAPASTAASPTPTRPTLAIDPPPPRSATSSGARGAVRRRALAHREGGLREEGRDRREQGRRARGARRRARAVRARR